MRNAGKHLAPILLAVAATAFFAARASGTSRPDRPDEALLSILKAADRVEVYRVDLRLRASPAGYIGWCPIARREKDQGAAFARRLGAALIDQKTYTGPAKHCIITPVIAYRIWSGKRQATARVWFQCNVL